MSKQNQFKKFRLCGVEVDAVTIPQAVDFITDWAAQSSKPAIYVVKPYVEFMEKASDPKVRQLLEQAELCLPDGVALNWAAYYLYGGSPGLLRWFKTLAQIVLNPTKVRSVLPETMGGINLTLPMLAAAAQKQLKVFLVGYPKVQSIEQTATKLSQEIGVKIVGTYTGKFPPGKEEELLAALNHTHPDLVLVGMGFPQQEKLMSQLVSRLDHGVLVGEGGSFDYREMGGQLAKAPRWLQAVGLEWLWRTLLEPSRLRRITAVPSFMLRIYRTSKTADLS